MTLEHVFRLHDPGSFREIRGAFGYENQFAPNPCPFCEGQGGREVPHKCEGDES